MNKVILMGNLGADPELRVVGGDNSVLKLRVATSKTWKNAQGEKQEKTEWHSCQLWGKRATALAPHLSKGQKVLIEGEIRYSEYEKDGEKRYRTDINIDEIEFAGGKGGGGGGKEFGAPDAGASDDPVSDEDIPF